MGFWVVCAWEQPKRLRGVRKTTGGPQTTGTTQDHKKVFDNAPADKRVDYACMADKKLVLKRVFLTPKQP